MSVAVALALLVLAGLMIAFALGMAVAMALLDGPTTAALNALVRELAERETTDG